MTIRERKMLNYLKKILEDFIIVIVMFGLVYDISFCWYSAKHAVYESATKEFLSNIAIIDGD